MPKYEISTRSYPVVLRNLETWEECTLTTKLERIFAERFIESESRIDELENKINSLTELAKNEKSSDNRPQAKAKEE